MLYQSTGKVNKQARRLEYCYHHLYLGWHVAVRYDFRNVVLQIFRLCSAVRFGDVPFSHETTRREKNSRPQSSNADVAQ